MRTDNDLRHPNVNGSPIVIGDFIVLKQSSLPARERGVHRAERVVAITFDPSVASRPWITTEDRPDFMVFEDDVDRHVSRQLPKTMLDPTSIDFIPEPEGRTHGPT